ncbi:M28 family peptidase [bacterium]|jgi:hypothetical protein|nr:M28 family peptidase [bacterium]
MNPYFTHSFARSTFLVAFLGLSSCTFPSLSGKPEKPRIPVFDAERAYQQILQYEKLGPAVPGSKESAATGDWILTELKALGLSTLEQTGSLPGADGKPVPIRNLLGRYQPEGKTRYLLSAHWDARPFADQEKSAAARKKPVPAVNDGGSGVVVLLGIAKALHGVKAPFGVDFLFVDAEDSGKPHKSESYCLGSQLFVKNPYPGGVLPAFGIHFDMVGRIGATFPIEMFSYRRGPEVLKRIHAAAERAGTRDLFPRFPVGPIVDDHVFLSEGLGIPVVDLIHMSEDGRFPPEWHTRSDTSEWISRSTLKGVGQTVLEALWQSP